MNFTPIRRAIARLRGRISSVASASAYRYGQFLFWTAVGIVVAAVLSVIAIEIGYRIPQISSLIQNPDNDFFGSSLNLILSIISLVFIVVIFLVQNANQEYSSRLSGVILRDRYFLAIIGFVLVGSIFSISGGYFGLGPPFTLIGYAFSIATILLVGALIAFAGYFINIANIIDYVTRQIESDISQNRIYQPNPFGIPLQDDEYIGQLTSQTQLLVSTCIKAIEQNQQPVVDSCLDSLTRITNQFLEETTERDVDEDFLQELNDQFRFIGSTAFDDYSRQKYSEKVIEAIGDIGIEITESRELGTPGGSWANLLGQLFQDSLEFDRTSAASLSIQKLGDMSITAIKQGDFDSVRVYQGELEDVSTICTTGSHPYLATLLQTLHGQYQGMYAAYLHALLTEGYIADYDITQLFEDFAESFNEAKSAYGHYNTQILYAGLFGTQPFAGKIAAALRHNQETDRRTQRHLREYFEELINFLRSISLNEVGANHPDLYKGYTQMLFVFEQVEPLEPDANDEVVSQLNDVWLDLVARTYEHAIENEDHVDRELNERLSDFIALLIYYHRDDPDAIAEFIEPLAETYTDLDESYDEDHDYADRNLQNLYRRLKLAGAWINRFYEPQSVTPQLWEILVEDFQEITESRSQALRPLMEQYGYPSNVSFSRDTWWLRPDTLWSYTGFQDEIAETLNGEDATNYVEFHERLEQEQ